MKKEYLKLNTTPMVKKAITSKKIGILIFLFFSIFNVQLYAQKRPNIVVFIADDMGWEASSPYGNPVIHTPNIQKVADEGIRYDNFFLTASSCSPSRVSILSGLYPHQTGAMNLHENIKPSVQILPDNLHGAGYYTMLVGKSHGTNNPKVKKKFDYFKKANWGKPWIMGDDWVTALKKRPKGKPFFMWAASIDPHRPFEQGEYPYHHKPENVIIPPYLPDIPEVRKDLADYYDEISRFDLHVGMAIKEMKKEGILDNTIILIMSDNGKAFAQAKTRVNVQGLKSPFILRYPKKIPEGTVSKALVSSVDIGPTLLDMVGAKPLKKGVGSSIVKTFKDSDAVVRKYAFAEHNWHSNRAYERAAISLDYLYIKNWLPDLRATPPGEVVRVPSYQKMEQMYKADSLDAKFSDSFIKPRPAEELFSIKKDFVCMHNLVTNKDYAKALFEMRMALDKFLYTTNDVYPGRKNLRADIINRDTGQRLHKKHKKHKKNKKTESLELSKNLKK